MKTKRRFLSLLLGACMLLSLLAGCSTKKPDEGQASSPSISADSSAVSSASEPVASEPEESQSAAQSQTATLYVGTKAGGFSENPLEYEGELTPEILIQGIADLTGWDLSLAEAVTSGKDGMSVCLSSTSSLFVGPPDPQKDEFHMFGAEQLAETILDSIQKTLQEGFTEEGGNPDALAIWYYMEEEQPLELPNIDRSWPIDQPYQWEAEQN